MESKLNAAKKKYYSKPNALFSIGLSVLSYILYQYICSSENNYINGIIFSVILMNRCFSGTRERKNRFRTGIVLLGAV